MSGKADDILYSKNLRKDSVGGNSNISKTEAQPGTENPVSDKGIIFSDDDPAKNSARKIMGGFAKIFLVSRGVSSIEMI